MVFKKNAPTKKEIIELLDKLQDDLFEFHTNWYKDFKELTIDEKLLSCIYENIASFDTDVGMIICTIKGIR